MEESSQANRICTKHTMYAPFPKKTSIKDSTNMDQGLSNKNLGEQQVNLIRITY